MTSSFPDRAEERILVLIRCNEERSSFSDALRRAGFVPELCRDMSHVCEELLRGAGAVLITDEVLAGGGMEHLQGVLARAPQWSDLPLIVINSALESKPLGSVDDEQLSRIGSVSFLERPVPERTLLMAARSALRARRRQYQVRDLFEQQQQAVQRVDLIAEVASYLLLSDKPEEVALSVFRRIAADLGLEMYLCYLLDEKRQSLRLSSHYGVTAEMAVEREWLDLHESFCGNVALQGKRVVAEAVQRSESSHLAHVKALGVTAYACFPLLASTRLIGTLSFGIRHRDRFDHEELAIMETVCNQVSVAIDRKRTEEALQELNQLLERRVEERTAQLQETNEQMEAFTYSISHDLRAPLRAIRGFAQALDEDYGTQLDATGRDYVARMATGAERLDRLIQDLLQYSRLSRSTISFHPVALDDSVQRVLLQLESDIHVTQAQVDVASPLPLILAHPATLDQVLANLVSNALKFVKPTTQPHVRIWGTTNGTTARLWVGDDGIGIAPAHHQRIFGVFERLHNTEIYPGTGIGLATVAKGVARMGGRVGVESVLGEGSQFWVELPKGSPELE